MRSSAFTFLVAALGFVFLAAPALAHDDCYCPAGQQGDNACSASSPNCGQCAVTAYKPSAGTGTCSPCPSGYDSRASGGTSCAQCTAGQYYSASAGCVTCAAGSANPTAGSSSCPSCQPGYYQPQMGQSYCIACPAGTHISSTRATQCYKCGSNQVASSGSAQCTTCPAGQQPNSDSSACVPIPSTTPHRRQQAAAQLPSSLLCPAGFSSCPTADRIVGSVRTPVFECVNTNADVESCGGCVNSIGGTGEDCTLFDPLAAASCVQGKCQYKCPRGYKLTDTGCAKLPKPRRSNAQRLTKRGL